MPGSRDLGHGRLITPTAGRRGDARDHQTRRCPQLAAAVATVTGHISSVAERADLLTDFANKRCGSGWTTKRAAGRDHAQVGVGGCLVRTGVDGSAATLNLADSEAPERSPESPGQPSKTLDHWAQLALRIGGRRCANAHGSGLVMRRSSVRLRQAARPKPPGQELVPSPGGF
jgi:hypothetical protein